MAKHLHVLGWVVFGWLLGGVAVAADAKVDFAAQIQPILTARCGKCHGEAKSAAKLRLDSSEAITASHKESLLVAGKPEESELFKRITLPAQDKKRMPKGGDPLPADQIELIRQWIAAGAPLGEPASAGGAKPPVPDSDKKDESKPADAAKPEPPKKPHGEEDPELAKLPPASAEAIEKLKATGASVMPVFEGSPLLEVSFAQAPSPPSDEALAALPLAADQIVRLDASGAQATAQGYAALAKLKNLVRLHLEKSTADDVALANVATLPRLEYLNLYNTAVTDAGLEQLKALKQLQKLYLWHTKATYDAAKALETAIPGLAADVGWDNPVVTKLRLTKQLETAKKDAETAAAKATEVQKQLEEATKAKDQAAASVTDIEKQLKALDAPVDAPKTSDAKPADGKPAEVKPEADGAPKSDKPTEQISEKEKAKVEAGKDSSQ